MIGRDVVSQHVYLSQNAGIRFRAGTVEGNCKSWQLHHANASPADAHKQNRADEQPFTRAACLSHMQVKSVSIPMVK